MTSPVEVHCVFHGVAVCVFRLYSAHIERSNLSLLHCIWPDSGKTGYISCRINIRAVCFHGIRNLNKAVYMNWSIKGTFHGRADTGCNDHQVAVNFRSIIKENKINWRRLRSYVSLMLFCREEICSHVIRIKFCTHCRRSHSAGSEECGLPSLQRLHLSPALKMRMQRPCRPIRNQLQGYGSPDQQETGLPAHQTGDEGQRHY